MGTIAPPSVGVIVGRFQVDTLHEGHLALLNTVSERHNGRVIVFIGCLASGVAPTKHDPLDFVTRAKMILEAFPAFTIAPINDKKTDELWSKELDKKISDHVSFAKVTLYGSRDSFAPHYKGRHQVKTLDLTVPSVINGSDRRTFLTNDVRASADFRAGVIYGMLNSFTRVIPTVDVAIAYQGPATATGPSGILLLMAKKPDEELFRFVGGHQELKGSIEDDAAAESSQEVHSYPRNLTYVGSALIDDWRYRDTPEGIKTVVFLGWVENMSHKADDDIEKSEWIEFEKLWENHIEPEHRGIFGHVTKYIRHHYIKTVNKNDGLGPRGESSPTNTIDGE
jgi:bifunctional NMN adenylyltransferase/nudix hydrolase